MCGESDGQGERGEEREDRWWKVRGGGREGECGYVMESEGECVGKRL